MNVPRTLLQRASSALLAAVLSIATLAGPSAAQSPEAPRAARVLVISVDGLRPDVLLRADMPALRGLMARGSFTMWARTIPAAITLPSHTSMLTGVSEERHGIDWNGDVGPERFHYPTVPTLFDVAHAAGLSTAMAVGKSKFVALARPGSLDRACIPPAGGTYADSVVADTVVRWIRELRPRVLFVHLPSGDFTGHDHGWGSEQQVAAAAGADRCVARVLAAYRAAHLLDSTIVIVSADHGGANHTHGADDPRSRTIPWIVAGPGVRADFDLSSTGAPDVRTEDTFATACWVLGLALPDSLDGRPVRSAFTP
jgi:arylsulfatase A-like enzyme